MTIRTVTAAAVRWRGVRLILLAAAVALGVAWGLGRENAPRRAGPHPARTSMPPPGMPEPTIQAKVDQHSSTASGSARGIVSRAEDGLAVAQAEVYVVPAGSDHVAAADVPRSVTDGVGRFAVIGIPYSLADLVVRADGYRPTVVAALTYADGEQHELSVVLRLGASVSGDVVDAGGIPIEGAEVRARGYGADPPLLDPRNVPGRSAADSSFGYARSDAHGQFVICGLSDAQSYTVEARKNGYAVSFRAPQGRLGVVPGTTNVRLVLEPVFSLTVQGIDAISGRPIPTLRVETGGRVTRVPRALTREWTSPGLPDPDQLRRNGVFHCECLLPPGPRYPDSDVLTVYLSAPGYHTTRWSGRLQSSGTGPVETVVVRLDPIVGRFGALTLVFRKSDGATPEGAMPVVLTTEDGKDQPYWGQPLRAGRIQFEWWPVGVTRIAPLEDDSIRQMAGSFIPSDALVKEGEESTVQIMLEDPKDRAKVVVHVAGEDGQPIAYSTVSLFGTLAGRGSYGEFRQADSEDVGQLAIHVLFPQPGPYRIAVVKPGYEPFAAETSGEAGETVSVFAVLKRVKW